MRTRITVAGTLERLARLEPRRLLVEPGLGVDEPGSGEPRRVSSGQAKNVSPVQPSPIVARTRRTAAVFAPPPYWATSWPPGRKTAARLR